jgi:cytochrome bd-type quinol oxidase subunit 2
MTPKRTLIALFLLMAVNGAIDATYRARGAQLPLGWTLPLALVFSFLCFVWYRMDSDKRHFTRSPWLNSSMVVLVAIAMPYYLLRSRRPGERLRALLRCAGFAVLLVLATAVGALLSGHAV